MLCRTTGRIGRAASALAAVLAIATAAAARPPEERGAGRFVARYAERLGLSEEQRAAVSQIVEASRARREALVDELEAARRDMRELLSQPVPDEGAVMAQAEVIGAGETELHKSRLRAMMEIRALLTPEQRAELLRMRDERHRHRDAQAPEGRAQRAECERRSDGREGPRRRHHGGGETPDPDLAP
jgi:Spy/CpxP family protein refolding chaperone